LSRTRADRTAKRGLAPGAKSANVAAREEAVRILANVAAVTFNRGANHRRMDYARHWIDD
jgi:hypothetical protein